MRKYLVLTRARVSAFAALAAFTGHVTGSGELRPGALVAAAGVWLLASGASSLNQVSERDIDSQMKRTRQRPLPAGEMSIRHAFVLSVVLIVSGLSVLLLEGFNPLAPLLAICALFTYNGLYTPLKRVTGLAILIGAVAGALPPAIGWALSGSPLSSPLLIALCSFFYLWQIPHFWMLLARHREDYERAGLPTLGTHLSEVQVKRIGLTWTAATATAGLMLPLFGSTGPGTSALTLMLFATTILLISGILGGLSEGRRSYFISSNIYILLVMLSLVSGSVYRLLPGH